MDEVTQVLFDMNGFRVLSAVDDPLDGELRVLVETIDPGRGCPDCGVVGQVKQRPVVSVRDATSAGRRVRVRWQKRRWSCLEQSCERGSWTEQHDEVGARRRTTRRCREQIAAAVTRGGLWPKRPMRSVWGGGRRCVRSLNTRTCLTGSGRSAGWVWTRPSRAATAGS